MELESLNKFEKGPCMEHFCEIWLRLAQPFNRRCHLSKKLTTHDTRHTTHDGQTGMAIVPLSILLWGTKKGHNSFKI